MNDQHNNPSKGSPRLGRLRGISPQSREKNYGTNNANAAANTNFSQSAQNANHGGATGAGAGGVLSSNHSNHPSYPASSNQSGQNNMNANVNVNVVGQVANS